MKIGSTIISSSFGTRGVEVELVQQPVPEPASQLMFKTKNLSYDRYRSSVMYDCIKRLGPQSKASLDHSEICRQTDPFCGSSHAFGDMTVAGIDNTPFTYRPANIFSGKTLTSLRLFSPIDSTPLIKSLQHAASNHHIQNHRLPAHKPGPLPPFQRTPPNLPILLWFHGGGLLQGSRASVAPHMKSGVSKYSYALVSADYRLAPQVTIDEIVSDVKNCLSFVHDKLPEHVPSGVTIDTSRIAVSGSSAGGYLALLAGLYGKQGLVKCVLPIYPITNPFGKFFTMPQPIPDGHLDESVVAPYLDRDAPAVAENEPSSTRSKMYLYMMQEANLADLLSVKKGDDTYIIAEQVKKRGSYVPCYILHGDADKFVGVEQADEVVEALRGIGAEVGYERLVRLDHFFDKDERVGMEGMYGFMKKHL